MNKTNDILEALKAGARHNKWDRATLEKMVEALFELGATCPYCGNAKEGEELAAKAEKASRASTHVVVYSEHPVYQLHQEMLSKIREQDLAEFGLEEFPHITVKYGFDDSDLEDVRAEIERRAPFTITFGGAEIFSRPDFDVLYIRAESEELRELNAALTPIGDPPNWPGYTPHMTLAYLAPQHAAKYLPIEDFIGMRLEVSSIEFADSQGNKTQIELRGAIMPFQGMSYEQVQETLRRAWSVHTTEKFSEELAQEGFYTYPASTWNDRIAVYWGGKYFEVPYAVMSGDEIVFAKRDKWTEVDRLEVWVAKHAEFLAALEKETAPPAAPAAEMPDDVAELAKSFLLEDNNCLKAIGETDDYWILANHIFLWGNENQRDAEGLLSSRKNADGSVGEWFEPDVEWESDYTKSGVLYIDIEHGREVAGKDQVIGLVDAKSAVKTNKGLFVKRLLSKQHAYTQWLKEMYDQGVRFSTSSEPVQSGVKKAVNGKIEVWPLKRDSVTFGPMEPRMVLDANWLLEAKAAIGEDMPMSLYEACVKSGILQTESEGRSELETAGAAQDVVARKRLMAAAAKAQAEIAAMAD